MSIEKTITADLGDVSYPIHIGRDIIEQALHCVRESTQNTKVMIVYDSFFENSVVAKLKRTFSDNGFSVFFYAMDAGKGNKNIKEALKVYGILEENNLARDSTLIAIGGGVIGDLSGFVASTWLRGMNLLHIPTSLMAMIDSSIGGKTAINFRQTINGVGSYHHPIANLIDLNLIDSLPIRDYRSGLAEVIKCAVINDLDFFGYLAENFALIDARSSASVIAFVSKTASIKISHVRNDVREGGRRLLLNYGHTLGHSIETTTAQKYQEQLRHGEGVSVGMVAAAFIAQEHLNLPPSVLKSHENLLTLYGLPISISAQKLGFDRDALIVSCIENTYKDKKRINNKLRLILATETGKASVFDDVPHELISKAFDYIIKA